jgi:hypothetical protein
MVLIYQSSVQSKRKNKRCHPGEEKSITDPTKVPYKSERQMQKNVTNNLPILSVLGIGIFVL